MTETNNLLNGPKPPNLPPTLIGEARLAQTLSTNNKKPFFSDIHVVALRTDACPHGAVLDTYVTPKAVVRRANGDYLIEVVTPPVSPRLRAQHVAQVSGEEHVGNELFLKVLGGGGSVRSGGGGDGKDDHEDGGNDENQDENKDKNKDKEQGKKTGKEGDVLLLVPVDGTAVCRLPRPTETLGEGEVPKIILGSLQACVAAVSRKHSAALKSAMEWFYKDLTEGTKRRLFENWRILYECIYNMVEQFVRLPENHLLHPKIVRDRFKKLYDTLKPLPTNDRRIVEELVQIFAADTTGMLAQASLEMTKNCGSEIVSSSGVERLDVIRGAAVECKAADGKEDLLGTCSGLRASRGEELFNECFRTRKRKGCFENIARQAKRAKTETT